LRGAGGDDGRVPQGSSVQLVFTVNTPAQHGLARYMADPAPYLQLPAFYQRKRDLFREGLAGTRFRLLPCEGTYFQNDKAAPCC
jgi:hypothetical protein